MCDVFRDVIYMKKNEDFALCIVTLLKSMNEGGIFLFS